MVQSLKDLHTWWLKLEANSTTNIIVLVTEMFRKIFPMGAWE